MTWMSPFGQMLRPSLLIAPLYLDWSQDNLNIKHTSEAVLNVLIAM